MLEIRPNCELCDKDLPAHSTEACICTYECTFCRDCATEKLANVCPNCGGGFTPRPIRPAVEHREGISLRHQPASAERIHLKHDQRSVAELVERLRCVPPKQR